MIGKPRESKASNALYQHVLTKNFEIIETFLSQFHELFRKQDQFEKELENIEQRISLIEQNDRKLEDLLSKSTEMYQKKMKALKQFILEKVKNSGQKIQITPPQVQIDPETRQEVKKQIITEYEKQAVQHKKFEDTINEQIKKLQWQLSNINQRVNSLTVLTNNLDEKFVATVQINGSSFHEGKNDLITQIQTEMEEKLLQNGEQLHGKMKQLKNQFYGAEGKLNARLQELEQRLRQFEGSLDQKFSNQQFKQFQATYKEDQDCIIREVKQNFANKKETKKMLALLDKKITKLENQEPTGNQTDEKIPPSASLSCNKRLKPSSLHIFKKQPKIQAHIDSSMKIRRLSHRKFLQDKFF